MIRRGGVGLAIIVKKGLRKGSPSYDKEDGALGISLT